MLTRTLCFAVCCFFAVGPNIAQAETFDFSSDFSWEITLPYGFSNDLRVPPQVLAYLVAQATGFAPGNRAALPFARNQNDRRVVAAVTLPSSREGR
jgi:hypothetical protein